MTDTWGIPSDVFWKLYVVTGLALVVVAAAYRILFTPNPSPAVSAERLTPPELGMLAGGPGRAIAASLAILRTAGIITVSGDVVRTLPYRDSTFDPFTRAVHAKLALAGTSGQRSTLARRLASETAALRQSLVHGGFCAPPSWSRSLTLNIVPLIVLANIGIARIVFGIALGKPVLFLVVAVLGVLIAATVLHNSDGRTSAGRAAVRTLSGTHDYLAPSARPAFAAYGPRMAGVSAALFAGSALLLIDPGLASAAGLGSDGGSGGDEGSGGCGGGGGGCGGGCGG